MWNSDGRVAVACTTNEEEGINIYGCFEIGFVNMAVTQGIAVEIIERQDYHSWSDGVPTHRRSEQEKPGIDRLEEHEIFREVFIGKRCISITVLRHGFGRHHHGGKPFDSNGMRGEVSTNKIAFFHAGIAGESLYSIVSETCNRIVKKDGAGVVPYSIVVAVVAAADGIVRGGGELRRGKLLDGQEQQD